MTDFEVICVGRLLPWKGVDTVIRAVQSLREKGNRLCLTVIGSGPEEKKLKAMAGEETTFLGNLPHEETLRRITHADLLVLNSGFEGYSHTLIEAERCYTPMAFSYCTGNIEFYDERVSQRDKELFLVQKFTYNNQEEIETCIKNVLGIFGKKDFETWPCHCCSTPIPDSSGIGEEVR